jgi:hypothetical protein
MEIDGSGYTRRAPGVLYPTCEDGTVIGGPIDGTWLDFKTDSARFVLLPGSGVGVVWEPDAPEGDPRRSASDPR